ncbi:MAG: DUF4157 domain-containing protein [Bacteroidota bacterium]
MKTHLQKLENKSNLLNHQKSDGTQGGSYIQDNRTLPVYQLQLKDTKERNEHRSQVFNRQSGDSHSGLPNGLKAGIEGLSGYSMDDVKVHYNSSKPIQLNVLAYAQGTDIHLGPGQEKHLPHEAWHVVQQKQGRVKPTLQFQKGVQINDDTGLEREADVTGEKAMNLINSNNQVYEEPAIVHQGNSTNQLLIQRKTGDYKKLWEKNPQIAKTSIARDQDEYWKQAKDFEEKLGAGLFTHRLAIRGADLIVGRIIKFLGWHEAFESFKTRPDPSEAGAVCAKDVKEVYYSGNLREKMYLVYRAINSTAFSRKQAINNNDKVAAKYSKFDLLNKYLPRRGSVLEQKRSRLESEKKAITKKELDSKRAPLSSREERLAKGKEPKYIPGEEWYELPDKGLVYDSSQEKKGENEIGEAKTWADYREERLAIMRAGLSGSTDWYFQLADIFKFSDRERLLLRLAALGQLLVNRDHSYHEIMHVAKTRGKLYDYPDELPIGYTVLEPFTKDQILKIAGTSEWPGDSMAEQYLENVDINTIRKGTVPRWVTARYHDESYEKK